MTFSRSRLLTLVCFAGVFSPAAAQQPQDTLRAIRRNGALRLELLSMKEREQDIRNQYIAKVPPGLADSVLMARMVAIDSSNTRRIKQIIYEFGWPGNTLVGQDGAQAAFLIVQHSPDTLFQRSCLHLMEDAFKAAQASGQHLALLTDRVLIREGRPQLYGTQAKFVDGKLVLYPIEDQVNVDKRRSSLGLQPLSEYLRALEGVYHFKDK